MALFLLPFGHRWAVAQTTSGNAMRPPAVPLVLHDPYFSIWSPFDQLHAGDTIHWTEKPHRLTACIRMNGKVYRLMGSEQGEYPVLPQRSLDVTPTRTIYNFANDQVDVSLAFITPALPSDLDSLARPVTYIEFRAQALGNDKANVQFYFDANADIAVNTADQLVTNEVVSDAKLEVLRVGTVEQPVLAKQGDDLRIDWGYLYLATEKIQRAVTSTASQAKQLKSFDETGRLALSEGFEPTTAKEAGVLSVAWDLGDLTPKESSRCVAMLAYDDVRSIRYFDTDLQPYWRRNGINAIEMLHQAASERDSLCAKCIAFDNELIDDAKSIGGETYAQLISLCHRQSLAGTKLVADANGQPLFFTKENNSNGCLGTVDVLYPQAPHLLMLSPALMKATLVPLLEYAKSSRWPFDFAPHDLGRYPHATGQVYGGGERTLDRQMMVEESANMLLLMAALAHIEGDTQFSMPYFELMNKWANYLIKFGYDPENQLCSDDFAGHLARNVNLSAKAICGIGAYAQLLQSSGRTEEAKTLRDMARDLASRWPKDSDDAGTHARLGFGLPDTWSQKYNLAWDRVLETQLFSDAVIEKEVKHYRKMSLEYGLPLDSRSTYTKLDWILWSATLASNREDFHALVDPVLKFINTTPDRTPLTDWYFTDSAKRRGFKARPVVGGVFMPMLKDPTIWKKWAARGSNTSGPWAPLVIRPTHILAATGEVEAATWQVNWNQPSDKYWKQASFTPPKTNWKDTEFPVGIQSDAGTPVRSTWQSRSLWARRSIQLDSIPDGELCLRLTHSGPVQVWINGVLALDRTSPVRGYQVFLVSDEAKNALRTGENWLAIHMRCNQPKPQNRDMIDVGLIVRK